MSSPLKKNQVGVTEAVGALDKDHEDTLEDTAVEDPVMNNIYCDLGRPPIAEVSVDRISSSNASSLGSCVSRAAQVASMQGSPPSNLNEIDHSKDFSFSFDGGTANIAFPAPTGFRLMPRNRSLVENVTRKRSGTDNAATTAAGLISSRGRKRSAQSMSTGFSPRLILKDDTSSDIIEGGIGDSTTDNKESPKNTSSFLPISTTTPESPTVSATVNFQGLTLQSPNNNSIPPRDLKPPPPLCSTTAFAPSSFHNTAASAASPVSYAGSFTKLAASPATTETSSFRRYRATSCGSVTEDVSSSHTTSVQATYGTPVGSPKVVPLTVLSQSSDLKQYVKRTERPPLQPSLGPNTTSISLDFDSETPSQASLRGSSRDNNMVHRNTRKIKTPRSAKNTPLPKTTLTPRSQCNGDDFLPRFPSPTDDFDIVSPMLTPRGTNRSTSSRYPGGDQDISFLSSSEHGNNHNLDDTCSLDLSEDQNANMGLGVFDSPSQENKSRDSYIPFPDWTDQPPVSAGHNTVFSTFVGIVPPPNEHRLYPAPGNGIEEDDLIFNPDRHSSDDDDGNSSSTNTRSDFEDDEFLLEIPATIAEEKQQASMTLRHSKQPRFEGGRRSSSFTDEQQQQQNFRSRSSFASSTSCASLRGIDYTASSTSLHGMELVPSTTSLRGLDSNTRPLSQQGRSSSTSNCILGSSSATIQRAESHSSIGLAIEASNNDVNNDQSGSGGRDLITPPVMSQAICPPPMYSRFGINKQKKQDYQEEEDSTTVPSKHPVCLFGSNTTTTMTTTASCGNALKPTYPCHQKRKDVSPRST